jgi:hypothetical protein
MDITGWKIHPVGIIEDDQGVVHHLAIRKHFKEKRLRREGLAIDALFRLCAAVLANRVLSNFCGVPPCLIDLDKGTIDGYPYCFSADMIDSWSLAMKLLLLDLKLIQCRTFQRSVHSEEDEQNTQI